MANPQKLWTYKFEVHLSTQCLLSKWASPLASEANHMGGKIVSFLQMASCHYNRLSAHKEQEPVLPNILINENQKGLKYEKINA